MVATSRDGQAGARPRNGSSSIWLMVAAAAAIMGFYLWTAQSPAMRFSIPVQDSGYYTLLADGFLSGQLAMKVEPDPELLKLKDPYDPEQSPQVPRMHDASLYQGKYYLYFGAAPALVCFVPWQLLTGHAMSENLAAAIFCCAGFALWTLLFVRIVRRNFPRTGAGALVTAVLLLGLGNMCAVMLRRAAFWEVPIAGAYFFNALWALSVWGALVSPRRVCRWLVLASVSLGLSVGSRPGGVFMAAAMGPIVWWLARPRSPGERWIEWRTARLLLAAWGPFALCIAGLLLYNYARFDHPLEFGTTYQLAGHNMHTWKMLDRANVPINVYNYFFSPAQFSVYFPFFEVIGNPPFPVPKGYYGVENVYGVVPNLPFVLLGFGAFGVFFRRRRGTEDGLAAWVAGCLLAFFSGLPVLLYYAASASRYMVDFVPWLIALALIGVFHAEAALADRPRWARIFFRLGWGALAAWTVLFNVFVSFQHNDLLRVNNPPVFAQLARFFNRASPLLEKLTSEAHGPLEIKLRLPKDRSGKIEPLVVTGLSYHADFVYLCYTDSHHVQVGFEHTGRGGKISQPIAVDYDKEQTFRIELGSLYPPETHPYFAGRSPAHALELKHRLKIAVNGVPYLEFDAASVVGLKDVAEFSESSPKDVIVGRDPINGAFGPKFSGTILSVERRFVDRAVEAPPRYGSVRLALQFPAGRTGRREPLVVTGRTGRGDLLYVSYVDEKHLRFVIDHWGVGETASEPIEVNYALIHVLEIDLGSLHPPPPDPVPKAGFPAHYEIKMEGVVVFSGEMDFHPSAEEEISLTTNPIGGSTASPAFTGRVFVRESLAPAGK